MKNINENILVGSSSGANSENNNNNVNIRNNNQIDFYENNDDSIRLPSKGVLILKGNIGKIQTLKKLKLKNLEND